MNHLQYLMVLAGCVLLTLPLEVIVGARVWRQPRRLASSLAPVLVVFLAWDVAAAAHGTWRFADRYTIGVRLPGGVAIEEVVFFMVVPIAGLLTLEAVRKLSGRARLARSDIGIVP